MSGALQNTGSMLQSSSNSLKKELASNKLSISRSACRLSSSNIGICADIATRRYSLGIVCFLNLYDLYFKLLTIPYGFLSENKHHISTEFIFWYSGEICSNVFQIISTFPNNRGPKIEPCGTPNFKKTNISSSFQVFEIMCWVR